MILFFCYLDYCIWGGVGEGKMYYRGRRPIVALHDMLNRRNQANTDAIFWCSDGGRVYGHRSVLSHMSPFFASVLALTGPEPANIIMAEESQDQVEQVVTIAYTGKCIGTPALIHLGSRLGVQVGYCYGHIC